MSKKEEVIIIDPDLDIRVAELEKEVKSLKKELASIKKIFPTIDLLLSYLQRFLGEAK